MNPKRIGQSIIIVLVVASGYAAYANVFGAATVSKTTTQKSLTQGLVGHWTFDGPDMLANVADISGGGNDGHLVNFTSTTTVEGKIGQALLFDGVDDYVDAGNDTSLKPNVFTISLWAKSDATELSALFRSAWGNGYKSGFALLQQSSGRASIRWGDGTNNDGIIYSANTDATEWRHIVGTYDGTTMKLYVNGELEGSDSTVNFSYSTDALAAYIGLSSGVEEFGGSIDDVRLYNRVLTAGEIRALYNNTKGNVRSKAVRTPNAIDNGLVSHWTFDGPNMSGTTVMDSGSGGNNGVLANGPTLIEGKVGQALKFKGVGFNQSVQITDSSSLFAGNTVTIAAWVKRADADDIHVIYSDYAAGETPDTEYNLEFLTNTTSLRFHSNSGASNENVSTIGYLGTYPLDEWIHVAVTWDGINARFYLNGELKDTNPFAYTPAEKVGTDHRIGERRGGYGDFEGVIDDVRFYNRTLSDAEIRVLYEATKGDKARKRVRRNILKRGLIAHWTFDGPDMLANAADISGGGNDGHLVNFTSTTTVEGKIGQALLFDGVDDYVEIPLSSSLTPDFVNTNNWTYSVWLKPKTTGATNQELFMGVWHRPRIQLSGKTLEINGFVSGVYTQLMRITNFFNADQWIHLAVVSDGVNYRVYKNGVEVAIAQYQQVDSGAGKYVVGSDPNAVYSYNGVMDDVRLYNRALSSKEIKLLYLLGR